jgi:pimeloyl-ACP methyl ester carboxylesterase
MYEGLPELAPLLANGFLVVVSDYQGLGTPGPHPYLDPKTAGYNIIDAVRAARQTVPDTSDRWVGYGFSQGGQAVWAANEMSSDYGAQLRLMGSVSVSPPTGLRPLGEAMEHGKLFTDQIVLLPLILKGLQTAHPELNFHDYLHGVLAHNMGVFLSCSSDNEALKVEIAGKASPDDYKPATPEAADNLQKWLGEFSLPVRRAPSPMLVSYGDSDPIVPAAWTADGLRRACALGDTIDVRIMPGQGHDSNLGQAGIDWISARFAGAPTPDSCKAS